MELIFQTDDKEMRREDYNLVCYAVVIGTRSSLLMNYNGTKMLNVTESIEKNIPFVTGDELIFEPNGGLNGVRRGMIPVHSLSQAEDIVHSMRNNIKYTFAEISIYKCIIPAGTGFFREFASNSFCAEKIIFKERVK